MARDGLWADVFGELMREHYDPLYLRSMNRNFAGMAQGRELVLADATPAAMRAAAQQLLSHG